MMMMMISIVKNLAVTSLDFLIITSTSSTHIPIIVLQPVLSRASCKETLELLNHINSTTKPQLGVKGFEFLILDQIISKESFKFGAGDLEIVLWVPINNVSPNLVHYGIYACLIVC